MKKSLLRVFTVILLMGIVKLQNPDQFYSRKAFTNLTKQSYLGRVITHHKSTSQLQCLHRCSRHDKCVDVVTTDDKQCWLLRDSKDDIGTDEDTQLQIKVISPVKYPG